jgi:hypothetical protein
MEAKMRKLASAVALLLALGSCSDVSGPEEFGRIQVNLTDAPSDYIEEAWVCISEVYLQANEGDNAGRTTLWEKGDGDSQCFDLLLLQGVSAELMDEDGVEVPAGVYNQLRLIVDSAHVVLKEGYTFSDGVTTEMELAIPSGAQSGIKVTLLEPIQAEPEVLTEITVDADVEMNFVIQGNPETPAGIQGILFTPHLVQLPPPEEP